MLYFALVAVALGVGIGLARGGRPQNLLALPFRGLWVPALALAAQGVVFAHPAGTEMEAIVGPAHMLTYGLLLLAVLLNRRLPGMPLIALGVLLNALVIGANGGAMPVAAPALERIGASGAVEHLLAAGRRQKSVLMTDHARLAVLGDWIPLAPLRTVISPGDVAIGLGGMLLVARGMGFARAASTHSVDTRAALENTQDTCSSTRE
jgi:hypothetical protein